MHSNGVIAKEDEMTAQRKVKDAGASVWITKFLDMSIIQFVGGKVEQKRWKWKMFFGEEKAFHFWFTLLALCKNYNFFLVKIRKSTTNFSCYVSLKLSISLWKWNGFLYFSNKTGWMNYQEWWNVKDINEIKKLSQNPKKKIVTSSVKIDWILKSNWWWWNPW